MDPVTMIAILGGLYGVSNIGADVAQGYWQRGTEREKIKSQEKITKAATEAASRLFREAKTSKHRDVERLTTESRRSERRAREEEMMRVFMEGQNQRMALVMQAMQSLGQPKLSQGVGGGGMLNMMRSNF